MLHTLLEDVDNHQIVENIVFPRVRYRDAEQLRSMQIQDPDNRVSDPTDLAVKHADWFISPLLSPHFNLA